MPTVHIVQDGSDYLIRDMRFGSKEGLVIYLKEGGITTANIEAALKKLDERGAHTIIQAYS